MPAVFPITHLLRSELRQVSHSLKQAKCSTPKNLKYTTKIREAFQRGQILMCQDSSKQVQAILSKCPTKDEWCANHNHIKVIATLKNDALIQDPNKAGALLLVPYINIANHKTKLPTNLMARTHNIFIIASKHFSKSRKRSLSKIGRHQLLNTIGSIITSTIDTTPTPMPKRSVITLNDPRYSPSNQSITSLLIQHPKIERAVQDFVNDASLENPVNKITGLYELLSTLSPGQACLVLSNAISRIYAGHGEMSKAIKLSSIFIHPITHTIPITSQAYSTLVSGTAASTLSASINECAEHLNTIGYKLLEQLNKAQAIDVKPIKIAFSTTKPIPPSPKYYPQIIKMLQGIS